MRGVLRRSPRGRPLATVSGVSGAPRGVLRSGCDKFGSEASWKIKKSPTLLQFGATHCKEQRVTRDPNTVFISIHSLREPHALHYISIVICTRTQRPFITDAHPFEHCSLLTPFPATPIVYSQSHAAMRTAHAPYALTPRAVTYVSRAASNARPPTPPTPPRPQVASDRRKRHSPR